MMSGLHAETTVFATIDQASRLALSAGWPWFGRPGFLGAGEVILAGSQPRPFRVRVIDARRRGGTVLCQLGLYELGRQDSLRPLLRADITLVRELSRTRLTLTGSTPTDLAGASPTQRLDSRRLGNEYARSLAAQIAECMERWLADREHPAHGARARSEGGT
jgi:hypothetical protein